LPQGYLLFVRQGTLLAQPFDAERVTSTGEPAPLMEQVFVDGNAYANFSAAENGSLAYKAGDAAEETQLTWFDRSCRVVGAAGPPGRYRNPLLSPDRTRVAVEMVRDADRNRDIWLLELTRGVLSRFTFDLRNDVNPVWSPDGSRIAFGSDREGGGFSLYQKAPNGAAAEELLFKSTVENAIPYSWSPDGQFILHRSMNGGAFNTGVLPLAGDRKTRLFQSVAFVQAVSQVSPDGRWIAYDSNESGRYEVFVQTFPTPGGKWQVSKDGGYYPKWRGDGREIFYYAADGQLMAVPVAGGAALEVGSAVPLFRAQMLNGPAAAVGFRAQYDVTPDGQRFLLNVPVENTQAPSITVVLNWAAGLGAGP
jgi:dipeptidyl aminopeptidase/acylaminoacyl peptidase